MATFSAGEDPTTRNEAGRCSRQKPMPAFSRM
jgi:hypothetical protein